MRGCACARLICRVSIFFFELCYLNAKLGNVQLLTSVEVFVDLKFRLELNDGLPVLCTLLFGFLNLLFEGNILRGQLLEGEFASHFIQEVRPLVQDL